MRSPEANVNVKNVNLRQLRLDLAKRFSYLRLRDRLVLLELLVSELTDSTGTQILIR